MAGSLTALSPRRIMSAADEPGRRQTVAMHVICPHCQNRVDVEDISTLTEILCEACGSSFRLAPAATTAWNPQDGQRKLGKFELLDAVGFGAFGTVFKAHDPELDRI